MGDTLSCASQKNLGLDEFAEYQRKKKLKKSRKDKRNTSENILQPPLERPGDDDRRDNRSKKKRKKQQSLAENQDDTGAEPAAAVAAAAGVNVLKHSPKFPRRFGRPLVSFRRGGTHLPLGLGRAAGAPALHGRKTGRGCQGREGRREGEASGKGRWSPLTMTLPASLLFPQCSYRCRQLWCLRSRLGEFWTMAMTSSRRKAPGNQTTWTVRCRPGRRAVTVTLLGLRRYGAPGAQTNRRLQFLLSPRRPGSKTCSHPRRTARGARRPCSTCWAG
ncbi:uncharacterized protein LOC143281487 [Babylonia areolata]|uniref:uncharacterized protein LOC143281487 n=1 Tax=Babylonia areolata TaxID=304850 RepID=UPI003FCF6708